MLILALVILGPFAGWAAHALVGRGRGPIDWPRLTVIGIAGSFVGGLLASLLAGDGLAIRLSGLLGSIIGATIVTLVVDRRDAGASR